MRRLATLFSVVLFIVALIPSRPVKGAPVLPGDFMGMVIRDPFNEFNTNPNFPNASNQSFYDALGQNIANAGVKWVRFEFRTESQPPSVYDPNDPTAGINFAAYDYFINTVAPRYNFKIIGLLATNLIRDASDPNAAGDGYLNPEYLEPAKAPPGDGEVTEQCYPDPGPNPVNPGYRYGCGTTKAMRIWLDHAFAIAAHYGTNIAAYEVMNEENRYIGGGGQGIDPTAMATLLAKFYRVFKFGTAPVSSQIIPAPWQNQQVPAWASQINLILGGIHPGRCDDCPGGGMTDQQYLDAIYKSAPFQGFRNTYGSYPLEGVGYHPYPMEVHLNPDSNEPTGIVYVPLIPPRIEAMAGVMAANGDQQHKLWITEVGDRGDPNDPANQARQAQFLALVYAALWQERAFVQTVLWFKYEDFNVVQNNENWGVVRLVPGSTTEYDLNGTVQVYKQSYTTYQILAAQGIPAFTATIYPLYLPIMMQPGGAAAGTKPGGAVQR